MKKLIAVILSIACARCVPATLPILPTVNFNVPVPPLPTVFVNLDGQWVMTDGNGGRSCLVVQESRVSILDLTCSSDGRGFVGRITDAPVIARAGDTITLTLTYEPNHGDLSTSRLSFSGRLQIDGSFIGLRSDQDVARSEALRQISAVLSRS